MPSIRAWMIGQFDTCAIVVKDEYASGVHCRVDQLEDGRLTVMDLGSTNGTYIENDRGQRRKVIGNPRLVGTDEALIIGRSRLPVSIFDRAEPTT